MCKRDTGNMCIDCGCTIPSGDDNYDPDTNEGPFCITCFEDRGEVDFDLGESDECED